MNDEAAQHTETSRQAPLLPPSEFSKDKFEVSFQPITPPQDTAEQAEERRLYNAEHPEHAKLLKPGGTQELFVEERRKTQVAILDQLIAQAFSTALPAGQELKQGCRYVTRDGRITPPLLWWTKEHPLNGPPMFVARFADRPVAYYRDDRCVMPADRAGSDLVAEAEQASCLAQEETWVVRMNREIEARYGPGRLAAGPEETSDEGQLAEENQ